MDIKVKAKSYGFRGRFWGKIGEIVKGISPDELKLPEMKHFSFLDGKDILPPKTAEKPAPNNPPQNTSAPPASGEIDWQSKTKPEIMQALDEKGIEYQSSLNKTQLLNLLLGGGQ